MIVAGEHPDNQPTILDSEVRSLMVRLLASGWDRETAGADARAACGARWDQARFRHVYTGYTDAPREAI